MPQSQTVVDKIKKLLRLSKSSNANEAALAAERAAELMIRHQITDADLGTGSAVGLHPEPIDTKRAPWREHLADAVAKTFGCVAYWSSFTKQIRICGEPADCNGALYVYAYLVRTVNRLANDGWRAVNTAGSLANGGRWKASFRSGFVIEVGNRLLAMRERIWAQQLGQGAALIPVDNRSGRAREFMASQSMVLAERGLAALRFDRDAFQAGMDEGGKIQLRGGAALTSGARRLTAAK